MTTRTPLMAGNWKMNLTHPEAVALVQKLAWILADKKHDYARTEVAVIPPFTDLRSVQTMVDGDRLSIRYGAQDVSVHDSGAYTGEISATMLAKLGCSYVVVGHSERRQYHGETDDTVNAKARQAVSDGADYLLLGSIFPTPTHPDRAPLGVKVLEQCVALGSPVIAIGGITAGNAGDCHRAGAWGVAAIRALWDAADPLVAARALTAPWEEE